MSRMAMGTRRAFSLLEIIIATAILAGSAMVLVSLISLGTKYGNRAEERTMAVAQAQSVMDEFIARLSDQDAQEEVNGVLPGIPLRGFRVAITPFALNLDTGSNRKNTNSDESRAVLYRISVELFEANAPLAGKTSEPLCHLVRLIRRPQSDEPTVDGAL